jgi:protein-tyrosine phosphatase
MPTILFVCTANRFRSPIAAACFEKELKLRKLESTWRVLSAGTWTADGMPAMPGAIQSASRMGLDLSEHTSQVISSQLMSAANLVIVMERGQKEALQTEFARSAHKVHLLSEAATGTAYDIPDPVTSAFDTDADVPGEIEELIHNGFDRICGLIRKY